VDIDLRRIEDVKVFGHAVTVALEDSAAKSTRKFGAATLKSLPNYPFDDT
jgi:hypothetical protein